MTIDVTPILGECWTGLDCGDVGGWLSGLGALIAAGVAVCLATRADRIAGRRARAAATAIFFEECFSISYRACECATEGRVGPSYLFSELDTLMVHRHRVADLPEYEARRIQRLITKISSANVAVQAILDDQERAAGVVTLSTDQRQSLQGITVRLPNWESLGKEFGNICSIATDLAELLIREAGGEYAEDAQALATIRSKLKKGFPMWRAPSEVHGVPPRT